MTVAALSTTLAVSHLLLALGAAGRVGVVIVGVAAPMMSAAVRACGVRSWTAPTSAICLRLRFSPLDNRVASLAVACPAALAVPGRSASGLITMPLPSTERTSRSSSATGPGPREDRE